MSEVPKALQTVTDTATLSAESSILIIGKSAWKWLIMAPVIPEGCSILEVKITICSVDWPPVTGFWPGSPPEYSISTSNWSLLSEPWLKDSFVKSNDISNLVASSE